MEDIERRQCKCISQLLERCYSAGAAIPDVLHMHLRSGSEHDVCGIRSEINLRHFEPPSFIASLSFFRSFEEETLSK